MERQSLLAAPIFCRSLARVPAAKGLLGLLPPSLASLSNEDDVDTMHRFRLWPAFTVVYHTSSSSSLLVCVCVRVLLGLLERVFVFFNRHEDTQTKMKSLFTPFTEGRGDVPHPLHSTWRTEVLGKLACGSRARTPTSVSTLETTTTHYQGHKKRRKNFPTAKHFPPRNTRPPPAAACERFVGHHHQQQQKRAR